MKQLNILIITQSILNVNEIRKEKLNSPYCTKKSVEICLLLHIVNLNKLRYYLITERSRVNSKRVNGKQVSPTIRSVT